MFNHVSTSDLVYHIKLVFKLIHGGLVILMLLDYDICPQTKWFFCYRLKSMSQPKKHKKKAHKSSWKSQDGSPLSIGSSNN